jgi:transcriptional regulator with XRE-family HTH domain
LCQVTSPGKSISCANSSIAKNCAESYVLSVPISAFGRNIKRLREALDPPLNGRELGEAIGRDGPTISKWEHGEGGLPETPTLFRLAKKLKAPIDEILAGVDEDYDALCRDLPRHTFAKSSPSHQGGAVDPASARVLEQERRRRSALVDTMQDVARRLLDAAAAEEAARSASEGHAVSPKNAKARARQSTSRRRARKIS